MMKKFLFISLLCLVASLPGHSLFAQIYNELVTNSTGINSNFES
ncbi:MAG: hypothetical protein R3B47_21170 [Bacteroidia bacterium]